MLELKNIYKYYNPGTVNEMCLFKGFNLTVKDGEFLSVVGSNGSGKTSMLNIICGRISFWTAGILQMQKSLKETKRSAVCTRIRLLEPVRP